MMNLEIKQTTKIKLGLDASPSCVCNMCNESLLYFAMCVVFTSSVIDGYSWQSSNLQNWDPSLIGKR